MKCVGIHVYTVKTISWFSVDKPWYQAACAVEPEGTSADGYRLKKLLLPRRRVEAHKVQVAFLQQLVNCFLKGSVESRDSRLGDLNCEENESYNCKGFEQSNRSTLHTWLRCVQKTRTKQCCSSCSFVILLELKRTVPTTGFCEKQESDVTSRLKIYVQIELRKIIHFRSFEANDPQHCNLSERSEN